MRRNHNLSSEISDASWSKFLHYLSYKAARAGKTVVKVSPRGTSEGLSWDDPLRDYISAWRILERGLEKLGQGLPYEPAERRPLLHVHRFLGDCGASLLEEAGTSPRWMPLTSVRGGGHMVRFAFELSKEHETLPKAEVLACLNALGIQFSEEIADFGFLLLDLKIKEAEAMKISACLASRLGMTHRIYIVLGAGESLREIAEVAKKAPIEAFFDGEKSFAVRVRRLSARAFALFLLHRARNRRYSEAKGVKGRFK
nr:THUMP domain-containing protein [Methanophagales archaeon]